jgi:1-aminocyclopropane-1-carboxylate synthase
LVVIGRCYPVETLRAIAQFCQKHTLHLISDEVYASCVFDTGHPEAAPFTSMLSFDLPSLIDPSLVHVLYGFSKVRARTTHLVTQVNISLQDFASGGLHLGFLVTQNEQLRRACKAVL